MKEFIETVGGILGFIVLITVLGLIFDPAGTQKAVISGIDALANIWHEAQRAFSTR